MCAHVSARALACVFVRVCLCLCVFARARRLVHVFGGVFVFVCFCAQALVSACVFCDYLDIAHVRKKKHKK